MGDKRSEFSERAEELQSKEDRLLGTLIRHWANVLLDAGELKELEDKAENENDPDAQIALAHTTIRLANSLAMLSETALILRDRIVPEELARPVADETAAHNAKQGRKNERALKKH